MLIVCPMQLWCYWFIGWLVVGWLVYCFYKWWYWNMSVFIFLIDSFVFCRYFETPLPQLFLFHEILKMSISLFYTCVKWKYCENSEKCERGCQNTCKIVDICPFVLSRWCFFDYVSLNHWLLLVLWLCERFELTHYNVYREHYYNVYSVFRARH